MQSAAYRMDKRYLSRLYSIPNVQVASAVGLSGTSTASDYHGPVCKGIDLSIALRVTFCNYSLFQNSSLKGHGFSHAVQNRKRRGL